VNGGFVNRNPVEELSGGNFVEKCGDIGNEKFVPVVGQDAMAVQMKRPEFTLQILALEKSCF
jgi:hypothetical protein